MFLSLIKNSSKPLKSRLRPKLTKLDSIGEALAYFWVILVCSHGWEPLSYRNSMFFFLKKNVLAQLKDGITTKSSRGYHWKQRSVLLASATFWPQGLWIPACRPPIPACSGSGAPGHLRYLPIFLQPSSVLLNDSDWLPGPLPCGQHPGKTRLWPLGCIVHILNFFKPSHFPLFPDLFKSQLLVSCLTIDHSLKLTSWIWQLILLLWLQSLAPKAAVPYASITAVSSTPGVPAPSKANQDPCPVPAVWASAYERGEGSFTLPQLRSLVSPKCAVWAWPLSLGWSDPLTQPGHLYFVGHHKELEWNERKCPDVHYAGGIVSDFCALEGLVSALHSIPLTMWCILRAGGWMKCVSENTAAQPSELQVPSLVIRLPQLRPAPSWPGP